MRKIRAFVDKQGFFILLAVCIVVIVGSGIWAVTRGGAEEDLVTDGGRLSQSVEDAERTRVNSPLPGSNVLHPFARTAWLETLGCYGAHEAVDLSAAKGAQVVAARDGQVTAAYKDGRWGGVVELTHEGGLVTRYASLQWPVPVNLHDAVVAGQAIGTVGTAAVEASDGAHLHFEMLLDGSLVDPQRYGL